jgi:hypothetical protein
MSFSFKKSYKLYGFIGVSVVLCHLKNMAHSNVIINIIAKEFLFLKRERKLGMYGNITWGIGHLLSYCHEIMTPNTWRIILENIILVKC